MKNNFLKLIILVLLIVPFSVFAEGSVSVSTRNININTGGSATFNVVANKSVGRVDISSSNNSVCSVSPSSIWVEDNAVPVTVIGNSAGNCIINVVLSDVSTYSEEELHNSYTISVNVSNPAPPPSTPTPSNPVTNNTNNTTNNNSNANNNQNVDTRSSNNNLKSITVEGFNLDNVDGVYKLTVKNKVDKIIIKTVKEDSKAKVSGDGEVKLNVGENKIDVVVTAENNSTKTYTLLVTRKDSNYKLSDLEDAIVDLEKVIVSISGDDYNINDKMLAIIKNSKKNITINKLDEENKTLYSWNLIGNNIKNTNTSLSLKISEAFEDKDNFDKLIDYRNGIYLSLDDDGSNFPKGTTVKYNVGNTFKNNDKIYVYAYNKAKNTIDLIDDSKAVTDGMIEIPISDSKQYFLTKALIESNGKVKINNNKNNSILIVTASLEFFVIAALLVFIVSKKKKKSINEDLEII